MKCIHFCWSDTFQTIRAELGKFLRSFWRIEGKNNCFWDFRTCSSDWSGNEVNDDIFEGTIIPPGMNKREFNEGFYPIWLWMTFMKFWWFLELYYEFNHKSYGNTGCGILTLKIKRQKVKDSLIWNNDERTKVLPI